MEAACLKPSRAQLVAGTYNEPAPSHIIRSVLVSSVRENPAMTADVTPEGLYNHNVYHVCTMMWHYTAPGCLAQGLGHRTLRQMGGQDPPTGRGKPAGGWVSPCKVQVVNTCHLYSRVLFDGKFHQAVAG